MQINDIIKKCIEIPGISIHYTNQNCTLILDTDEGTGSMTFFPLFPGFTLAYIFVNSPTWPAPDLYSVNTDTASDSKPPLLLNYCISGRCEMLLNNKNYVYVKENELSLSECFAQSQYVYPLHAYEGIEFFIDIQTILSQTPWIFDEFCIDFKKISAIYCPDESTYIQTVSPEIERVLSKLWNLFQKPSVPDTLPTEGSYCEILQTYQSPTRVFLPNPLQTEVSENTFAQMKIYAITLFSLLLTQQPVSSPKPRTFFTETQVRIAKEIEQMITTDLHKHYPARQLASKFSISETSMKNYFRGVFGQNISVYLREIRMKKAAELLKNTNLPVSKIAEQVGYMNQSKFASVFKKQMNMSPLEYRRSSNLQQ